MKARYFLFVLQLCVSMSGYSQQCGVYKTVADYRGQHLSLVGDCKYGKGAIQVSDFFLRPYVYVRTELGKFKIHEDSVYAIQSCEGDVYRLDRQKVFRLLEKGVLNIYSYTYEGTEKKWGSRTIRYEKKEMVDYYFSVGDSSAILPLTVTNVRLALLSDKELDKKIQHRFADNSSLMERDKGVFCVNLFLSNEARCSHEM